MIIGIDPAQPGSDKTVVTSRWPLMLNVGDRVAFDGEPRSVLHHVKRELNETSAEISTYVRPSKGFRKHLRRQKAANR